MLQITLGPGPVWLNLLVAAFVVALGIVTALKGRWLWLIPGLLLSGLVLVIPALLPPKPGSRWDRLAAGRRSTAVP